MIAVASDLAELMEIARRAETEPDARWEFARHPKIVNFLKRETWKAVQIQGVRSGLKFDTQSLKDVMASAAIKIVEIFADTEGGMRFGSEGELISYWNARARSIVESSIRQLGGYRFHDGRVVRKEFPAHVEGDEARRDVGPGLRRRSTAAEEAEASFEHGEAAREAERRVEVARGIVDGEDPVRRCARMRVDGRPWPDVVRECGFKNRAEAKEAYQAFLADRRRGLIESGEDVVVKILGAYVGEAGASLIVVEKGRVVEVAAVDASLDVRSVEAGIKKVLDRGVASVAANDGPITDVGMILKVACMRRGVEWESFDFGLISRGVEPSFFAHLEGMDEGQKRAYLLARAKEVENQMKKERY